MSSTGAFTEVRDNFSQIIDQVENGAEWIITRHGRPVAALIAIDDYENLLETLNILSDRAAVASIDEGLADLESGDLVER